MPARNRAGFSLIQLMVTLAISGIIVSVVFRMLLGQGQITRLQSAKEETQQDARAAVELITAELRSVGPEAVVTNDARSISFRTPRAWGMVCRFESGRLTVLFPEAAVPSLRLNADSLAVPVPLGSNSWQFVGVTDITGQGSNAVTAVNQCNADLGTNPATLAAAIPANSRARIFQGVPAGLSAGGRIYVFNRVTYDVGTTSVPGQWIRRNGHPLAGPLSAADPGNGLRLAYRTAANVPTIQRHDIQSVRVAVAVESRAEFNGLPQKTSDSTVVFLRNRN